MTKPTHVKPALYAFYYQYLKEIAVRYGYNLVLHGSMNRDLDLIAIPWVKELGSIENMMNEFAEVIGGDVMKQSEAQRKCFPHGRESWVINVNRGVHYNPENVMVDANYYLDISVIPALKEN